MNEKLRKLDILTVMTKEKIEKVREKTNSLRITNYKLEALLEIMEALSISTKANKNPSETTGLESIPETIELEYNKKITKEVSILKNSDFFDTPFNETIPIVEQKISNNVSKWTYDGILEKISEFKNNTLFLKNTHKIVSALKDSSDGLNIENIIKKTGVSKYRCIDIINELTKITPHILHKRYEKKNYIYFLNI